jgi:hypothetical protein
VTAREELDADAGAIAVEYRPRDLHVIHARRVPWPGHHG